MPNYGMVIDLDRCTGCRACMVACKIENNTPESHFWMYVFRLEEGKYPNTRVTFLPRPCMHCDNAPCAKVCPVGARFKQKDGLVATDWGRCIGCRYCLVACPYGVNYVNWKDPKKNQYLEWDDEALRPIAAGALPYANPDLEGRYGDDDRKTAGGNHMKGVMEKCTFCVHRLQKGLQPACVSDCPAFAMHFGDLDDPESDVSKILQKNTAFRLEEDLGTRPKVYYIGQPVPGGEAREIEAIVAGE